MTECALCPKGEYDTWLGGYEVGEYVICTDCYHRYIAGDRTPPETERSVTLEDEQ